ncbi:MAG: aldehyde dehydrogenase family protein, partial [Deltaproteobacteria bacterium]|nr:aldehyde dehydrogenase family protein [Deltaproteobacteria bacterium]
MNPSTLRRTAERAREAARVLSTVSAAARTAALEAVAAALLANESRLLTANQRDLDEAVAKGMEPAMLDRLALNPARIAAMAAAVREVALQADPVGEVAESSVRPNGLRVSRVRMPLGVIAVIYEARPNVTSDASALAIRSGNAILLKGGSEAKQANLAIGEVVSDALAAAGLPAGSVQVLAPSDRAELVELLQFDDLIDLVIPRGGEGLIRFVAEHSRIPVIKHYKG